MGQGHPNDLDLVAVSKPCQSEADMSVKVFDMGKAFPMTGELALLVARCIGQTTMTTALPQAISNGVQSNSESR